jgi:hypothetical protein
MEGGQGVIAVISHVNAGSAAYTCLSGTLSGGTAAVVTTASPFTAALADFGEAKCSGFNSAVAADNFIFAGFKNVPAATSALLKTAAGKT